MNHRSGIDRVLQTWMADGPAAIPDRVVDVVAVRIGVQRQRRAWPFRRRTTVFPSQIKLVAGLAAAVLVAVVGYSLLPRATGPGGSTTAPSPSPQLTALVTAAPSAIAGFPAWYTSDAPPTGPGIISAGTHTTKNFNPALTFTVPSAWVNDADEVGYFSLFPNTTSNQAAFGRSETVGNSIVMGPRQSPWFTCESAENNGGATAAEIVAAMAAGDILALSGISDVEIGGLTGKQVDVRRNPEWSGTCPDDAKLPPGVDPADERTRGIMLDVPGRGVLLMLVYSMHSADTEAFLAEAMPIIQSFEFDIQPASS